MVAPACSPSRAAPGGTSIRAAAGGGRRRAARRAAMAVPVETARGHGRPDPAPPDRGRLAALQRIGGHPARDRRADRRVPLRRGRAGRARASRWSLLDDSVWRAAVEQAQAALELSQANYERAVDLLQRKAGTTKARDEAFSQMRVDEAELELAKARLDKSVITAPFDGVVGLRKVSVGDFVNVGDDIVNLEQIDPLKADFRVAEVYLGAVRPGQRDRARGRRLPGRDLRRRGLCDRPADRRERPQHPAARAPAEPESRAAAGAVRPGHPGAERARGRDPGARAGAGAAGPGPVRVQGRRRQGGADQGRRSGIRREGMVEIVDGPRPRGRGGDRGPAQAPRRRRRSSRCRPAEA